MRLPTSSPASRSTQTDSGSAAIDHSSSSAAMSFSIRCRSSAFAPHAAVRKAGRSLAGFSRASARIPLTLRHSSGVIAPTDTSALGRRGADLLPEKGLGRAPLALDGGGREAERLGRLLDRHAREEAQLHDARLIRVEPLEPPERSVELEQVEIAFPGVALAKHQSHAKGAALPLGGPAPTRMVDEDSSHDPRGDAEEVGAALPRHVGRLHEPQVGLMDESGRLEGMVAPLLAQVSGGEAPQLVVDDGKQLVESGLIAAIPLPEQLRDTRRRGGVSHDLA